jgi:hypothetical protein
MSIPRESQATTESARRDKYDRITLQLKVAGLEVSIGMLANINAMALEDIGNELMLLLANADGVDVYASPHGTLHKIRLPGLPSSGSFPVKPNPRWTLHNGFSFAKRTTLGKSLLQQPMTKQACNVLVYCFLCKTQKNKLVHSLPSCDIGLLIETFQDMAWATRFHTTTPINMDAKLAEQLNLKYRQKFPLKTSSIPVQAAETDHFIDKAAFKRTPSIQLQLVGGDQSEDVGTHPEKNSKQHSDGTAHVQVTLDTLRAHLRNEKRLPPLHLVVHEAHDDTRFVPHRFFIGFCDEATATQNLKGYVWAYLRTPRSGKDVAPSMYLAAVPHGPKQAVRAIPPNERPSFISIVHSSAFMHATNWEDIYTLVKYYWLLVASENEITMHHIPVNDYFVMHLDRVTARSQNVKYEVISRKEQFDDVARRAASPKTPFEEEKTRFI